MKIFCRAEARGPGVEEMGREGGGEGDREAGWSMSDGGTCRVSGLVCQRVTKGG